jgi:hypothetical protein
MRAWETDLVLTLELVSLSLVRFLIDVGLMWKE